MTNLSCEQVRCTHSKGEWTLGKTLEMHLNKVVIYFTLLQVKIEIELL